MTLGVVYVMLNKNKKCHSHVTNAPKGIEKHKTHLRKVSCNIEDMQQI